MNYKKVIENKKFMHRYLYKEIEGKPRKIGVVLVNEVQPGIIGLGWSVCSEKDTFSKSKGKAIAYFRSLSNKASLAKVPDFIKQQAFTKAAVMTDILTEKWIDQINN